MAADLEVARTLGGLRGHIAAWRQAGHSVGLVPTMGGLHEGHLSLVRLSLGGSGRTVVSLFVNPGQFAPGEDFETYPRDEAADIRKLAEVGAHLLYAPTVDEIFPPGHAARVSVPGLGDILEGEFRPGFFTGVATVVAKLLLQVLPDRALFGEKDYQQLLVIRRLAADLDIEVAIEGAPTVRQADGLALSSRNAYLSEEERQIAPALYRSICSVAEKVAGGADPEQAAARGVQELAEAGFGKVDYLVVRDAATLEPVSCPDRPARVLAAARLGDTRLIDNVAV